MHILQQSNKRRRKRSFGVGEILLGCSKIRSVIVCRWAHKRTQSFTGLAAWTQSKPERSRPVMFNESSMALELYLPLGSYWLLQRRYSSWSCWTSLVSSLTSSSRIFSWSLKNFLNLDTALFCLARYLLWVAV